MEPLAWNYTYSVLFYPLFECYFQVIKVPYHTQKLRKIKFQPTIKLNHNIQRIRYYHEVTCSKAKTEICPDLFSKRPPLAQFL